MLRSRDDDVRELMDRPALTRDDLRPVLADLRHINLLLGWRMYAVRAVARYLRGTGLSRFSLVDVASGSGDIPLAIARWARRSGITAWVVATDVSPAIVAVAREQLASVPGAEAQRQDALALSYPDGAFDVALCTLALHHFAADDAVTLLRGMARVGQHVFVFDLVRSPLAYAGAVLLTRLGRMNPMTRHDGPASVRRAYTAAELRELAARAGLRDARVRVRFPFRLELEASGGPQSANAANAR
jgi:2-polyprenyl-3-methyl-5-hydroxy-6-metoxy-1,4-benzoquinol methylase